MSIPRHWSMASSAVVGLVWGQNVSVRSVARPLLKSPASCSDTAAVWLVPSVTSRSRTLLSRKNGPFGAG